MAGNSVHPLDYTTLQTSTVYHPHNYRGIYLTPQLSKVVERIIKAMYLTILLPLSMVGLTSSPMRKGGELAMRLRISFCLGLPLHSLANSWAYYFALASAELSTEYVSSSRLMNKLKAKKARPDFLKVLESWLMACAGRVQYRGAFRTIWH